MGSLSPLKIIALIFLAGLLAGCDRIGTEERLRAAADLLAHDFNYNTEGYNVSYNRDGNGLLNAESKYKPSDFFTMGEPEKCKFVFAWKPFTQDVFAQTIDFKLLRKPEVYPTISGLRRIIYLTGEPGAYSLQTHRDTTTDNKARLDNLLPDEVPAYLTRLGEFLDKWCGIKMN